MQEFEKFYKEYVLSYEPDKKKKILDLGGTINFWETMDFKYFDTVFLTLLNLEKAVVPENYGNISSVAGDAADLKQYRDQSFDLVFSNSVIEHVGGFEAQRRMANEMIRTGKHGYLQTPNRYFILEPHYLVPFFQFFPVGFRAFLIRHFQLGNMPKAENNADALELAESVRLLTEKELRMLFPGVRIRKEKIGFMTKSFYLYF